MCLIVCVRACVCERYECDCTSYDEAGTLCVFACLCACECLLVMNTSGLRICLSGFFCLRVYDECSCSGDDEA